jgi:hypothetical protein
MFYAISAVIFIYAMYTAGLGSQNNDLTQYFFAGFYFLGGFGLIFKKAWSKYAVYLVAALMIRNWWYPLWEAHEIEWPFHVTIENIIPLVPGLVLIILCLCGCIVVHWEIEHKE